MNRLFLGLRLATMASLFLFGEGRARALLADITAVARSGQVAPGAGGPTFTTFDIDSMMVNDTGVVGFTGLLTGPFDRSLGLWTGSATTNLALRAQWGDQATGLPAGRLYGDYGFNPPYLNANGDVSFAVGVNPVGFQFEVGAWTTAGGSLRNLAAVGYPLPNLPGPSMVAGSSFTPKLNEAGQSALLTSANGVTTIYVDTPGQPLRRVVGAGDTVPGGSGAKFSIFSNGFHVDGSGRVAFDAYTNQPSNSFGLWAESSPGVLTKVAQQGDPAPGAAPFQYTSINSLVQSSTGLVAFDAFLGGPSSGGRIMYAQQAPGGRLRIVARAGMTAPGTAGTITNFFAPSINASGRIAFGGALSTYVNPTGYSTGIWAENAGGMQLVARGGTAPPGLAGTQFDTFDRIQFNDVGQVLYEAALKLGLGGVTDLNNDTLWLSDGVGPGRLIAREGGMLTFLDTGGVATREIQYLDSISAYTLVDTERRVLNNQGQVAFWAQFTDGSSGVFVTQAVPEPSAVVLAAFGIGAALARKRRPRQRLVG